MTILSNLIGRTAIAVRAGVHKSMVLETPDHFSFPAHKKKKEKGRRRQTRVNQGQIQSEALGCRDGGGVGLVEIVTFHGRRHWYGWYGHGRTTFLTY